VLDQIALSLEQLKRLDRLAQDTLRFSAVPTTALKPLNHGSLRVDDGFSLGDLMVGQVQKIGLVVAHGIKPASDRAVESARIAS
jgi:hypothetical protein